MHFQRLFLFSALISPTSSHSRARRRWRRSCFSYSAHTRALFAAHIFSSKTHPFPEYACSFDLSLSVYRRHEAPGERRCIRLSSLFMLLRKCARARDPSRFNLFLNSDGEKIPRVFVELRGCSISGVSRFRALPLLYANARTELYFFP